MSTRTITQPRYAVDARHGFCAACGRRELLTVIAQDPDDRELRFCSACCWYRWELRARTTGGEAA